MTATDIVFIDIDIFKDCYQKFNKNNISQKYIDKKNELIKTYNCFFENQPYEKKNVRVPYESKNHNKLHIISGNFTEETKIRKGFTGLLNKLSPQNKDSLYIKINDYIQSSKEYKELCYTIVWDFIKQSSSLLYIGLIDFFDINISNEYIQKFIQDKKWYPSDEILNNNVLNNEMYDLYCDYVKWKKQTKNIFDAVCILSTKYESINNHMLNQLIGDIFDLFKNLQANNSTDKKHIIDFTLELLDGFLKLVEHHEIKLYLQKINLDSVDKSTKFFILNILEKNTS